MGWQVAMAPHAPAWDLPVYLKVTQEDAKVATVV